MVVMQFYNKKQQKLVAGFKRLKTRVLWKTPPIFAAIRFPFHHRRFIFTPLYRIKATEINLFYFKVAGSEWIRHDSISLFFLSLIKQNIAQSSL